MERLIQQLNTSNFPLVVFFRTHIGLSKFLVVGGLNTALDICLYFVFSSLIGLNPVLSNILSTGITLCVSFYLNHRFVFRSQKKQHTIALQFVAITLFNAWVVQSLIINAIVHGSPSHLTFFMQHEWTLNLVAKLCSVAVSFVLNFLGYRYIFKTRETL